MERYSVKKIINIFSVIILIIFIIRICLLMNPLRGCECEIKSWVLTSMPYGTDINDVESIADEEGWRINTNYTGGSYNTRYYKLGAESMRINIGSYRNIFVTDVVIFPIFDNDGKLIEIYVEKYTDGL